MYASTRKVRDLEDDKKSVWKMQDARNLFDAQNRSAVDISISMLIPPRHFALQNERKTAQKYTGSCTGI